MGALSNWAESGILNLLFRGNDNSFGAPSTVAVALCSNVPAETDTGSTMPEVADSNNYARVDLGAPANADWNEITQNPSSSGLIDNAAEILFNTATGGAWGYVSGVALVDNPGHGSGNIIYYGALTTPRIIEENDQFRFSAGELDLLLS